MTNKTEMVSLPRELLERLQAALSTSYCPELSLTTELWKLLAAPAEDVRAVGEEPVAAMYEDGTVLVPGDCLDRDIFEIICSRNTPLYRHPQRPVVLPVGKYDEVLGPFTRLMERELHSNAYKGDRPAWLKMSAGECLLEIYYHAGKLHKAVHGGDCAGMQEYAADVANLSMMLTDITGALSFFAKYEVE